MRKKKMQKQKRFTLQTLGCRLNQSETAMMGQSLKDAGYTSSKDTEAIDLAVINTCTVTQVADAKARNFIRSIIRKNPKAFIAVVGCYSQMGYKAIAEIPGVDLIIGNQEKLNIINYIQEDKSKKPLIIRDRILKEDFTIKTLGQNEGRTRANLKIQDGCDFMCSFCIIPFARGRARSREWSNILEEAQQLAKKGFKELVLTGVNVGTFASCEHGLVDLVDALNNIEGLSRVRISSIEPTTVPEELFERMADSNHSLVPYLHIPIQSGSDQTLKDMKRLYTIKEFDAFIKEADRAVPDLCIGTDVMVGFPSETSKEFEETYAYLKKAPLAYFHVFSFSEREGTLAVKIENKVSNIDKKERSARLRALSEHKRMQFYEKFLGQLMTVLLEEEMDGVWSGLTENYIKVLASDRSFKSNTLVRIKMESLVGDIVCGS
jgi:threonylcarbamoyladenosine tRNA methylthiotransferase MtaB